MKRIFQTIGLSLASLISFVLWIGLSSVLANAMHSLATSNFAMRPFGSVSAWLSIGSAAWCLVAAWILVQSSLKRMQRTLVVVVLVGAWATALLVFSGFADELLKKLGLVALGLWLLELSGGYVIATCVFRSVARGKPSIRADVSDRAFLVITALLCVKVLVIFLVPGISIGPIP